MRIELLDSNNNQIKTFENLQECADYFQTDKQYISHNLKYCKKIRKDDLWLKIRRKDNE